MDLRSIFQPPSVATPAATPIPSAQIRAGGAKQSGLAAKVQPMIYMFSPEEIAELQQLSVKEKKASGILGKVAQAATVWSDVSKSANAQRKIDAKNGVSLRQGATNYADTLLQLFNGVILEADRRAQTGTLQKDPQKIVGVAAEALLLNSARESIDSLIESWAAPAAANAAASTGAAAAGSAAAASSGANGAAAQQAGAFGSTAGMIVGGIGAANGLYELFKGFGKRNVAQSATHGMAVGAYIGSFFTPIGTGIGALIGAAAGALLGFIKNGKHQDQLARDSVRDNLKKIGMVNDNWQLSLADGKVWDIGKDGGFTLQSKDGTTRRAYEADFSNPITSEIIGWVQPLAALVTGGNKKLKDDFTGYFTNAVIENSTTPQEAVHNTLALYQKTGLSFEELAKGIAELQKSGAFTKGDAEAFINGLVLLDKAAKTVKGKNSAAEKKQAA